MKNIITGFLFVLLCHSWKTINSQSKSHRSIPKQFFLLNPDSIIAFRTIDSKAGIVMNDKLNSKIINSSEKLSKTQSDSLFVFFSTAENFIAKNIDYSNLPNNNLGLVYYKTGDIIASITISLSSNMFIIYFIDFNNPLQKQNKTIYHKYTIGLSNKGQKKFNTVYHLWFQI